MVVMLPASSESMPARILRSVDLPVPLAPTMPARSLGVTRRVQVLEECFGAEAFGGPGELDHLGVGGV